MRRWLKGGRSRMATAGGRKMMDQSIEKEKRNEAKRLKYSNKCIK